MATKSKRATLNIVQKVHRFTHAPAKDMGILLRTAGYNDDKMDEIFYDIYKSCDICASTGRPANMKKVSIMHINESFNRKLQADFMVKYIRGERFDVLSMVDTWTGYGERVIVPSRNATIMKSMIESRCFCEHEAPKAFSADPKFFVAILISFMQSHNITILDRWSRSSSKKSIIKSKNGVSKSILSLTSNEKSDDLPGTIILRSSMLTNILHGLGVLSSSQLATGYCPSILGIPTTKITDDIFRARL